MSRDLLAQQKPSGAVCGDHASPELNSAVFNTPFSERLKSIEAEKARNLPTMFTEVGILPFVRVFKRLTTYDEILNAGSVIQVEDGLSEEKFLHVLGERIDPSYSASLPRWIPWDVYCNNMDHIQSVKDFMKTHHRSSFYCLTDKPYIATKYRGYITQEIRAIAEYIKSGGQDDIIIFPHITNMYGKKGLNIQCRKFFHTLGFKAVKDGLSYKLKPFNKKATSDFDFLSEYPSKTGLIRVSTLRDVIESIERKVSTYALYNRPKIVGHFRGFYVEYLMKLIEKTKVSCPPISWRTKETSEATKPYLRLMLEAKAAMPKMRKLVASGRFVEATEDKNVRNNNLHDVTMENRKSRGEYWYKNNRENQIKAAKAFLKFLRAELKTFDVEAAKKKLLA